jgi:hypothetical protein
MYFYIKLVTLDEIIIPINHREKSRCCNSHLPEVPVVPCNILNKLPISAD